LTAAPVDQRSIKLDGVPPFEMKVHAEGDIFISQYILRDGIWEPCETKALIKLLAADTDFLDIGANIGWYTILASGALKDRGMVHAFEPDPSNFSILMENVALNKVTNASCHNAAASDHSAGGRLFLDTINKGDHRLYDSSDGRDSVEVRTISIDEYDGIDSSRALVIKLDTQGSEVPILRGMKKLLVNHPKEIVLICEFWPFGLERNGNSAGELIEMIASAGFEPFTIGENKLVKSDWPTLLARSEDDCAPSTQHHADFVAFRSGSKMKFLVQDMIVTDSY
jgi:FkbM family methyltransferase